MQLFSKSEKVFFGTYKVLYLWPKPTYMTIYYKYITKDIIYENIYFFNLFLSK